MIFAHFVSIVINMRQILVISVGNFWEAQDFFARVPGVEHTAAGYAGGTSNVPSFHNQGDHIEAVRVEFLPRVISFEEILMLVCEFAYESNVAQPIVFYIDQTELERINEWRETARYIAPIADDLECVPLTTFHSAEGANQHYLARLRGEDVAKIHANATDLQK